MGQKVHPESMRVGYIHDWKSNWFNEKHFADYLAEDVAIRNHITGKLAHAGLSDITIRKDANEVEVNIHTARPGIVIGKSGSEVDALRKDLHRMTRKQIKVNILEIKRPELDANLVAQSIRGKEMTFLPPAGGSPASHMYFLNTNYLFFRPHQDRNMVVMDPDRYSTNQDAVIKLIGWAGNMTISNGFLQGVLK